MRKQIEQAIQSISNKITELELKNPQDSLLAGLREARDLIVNQMGFSPFRYHGACGETGIVYAATLAHARGIAHKLLLGNEESLDYYSFRIERV